MDERLSLQSVACPDCDLLQQLPPLPPGGRACCPRCHHTLAKNPAAPRDLPLALTLTALVAFVIANTSPLMQLSVLGRSSSTTVIHGAYEMWIQGEELTGALVAFCAVIAPGGYLAVMLAVLLAQRRSPTPRWAAEMQRWIEHFQEWSMLEVMMLGILVALIKIAELASVAPGLGMYAVGALILLFPAITLNFDVRDFWRKVEWADGELPSPTQALDPVAQSTP